MMKKIVLNTAFVYLLVLVMPLNAQNKWNLPTCVDFAIKNNVDLNIKKNEILNRKINLTESKANLFPDLNLGSSVNINYGRNIDGTTNAITYQRTVSNSLWLSSHLDVFQGLVKHNTIQFNKYLLKASKEETEYLKNQLIFNVITNYYITLYSIRLVDVAESQVKLSEMQYKRMQKLVDVGRESQITVQDLKSQWISDKLELTKAENLKTDKILELKQLLRLNANDSFEIDTTNALINSIKTVLAIDSIYGNAINFLPQIKQEEYLLAASKKDLAISRGKISPHLYLSAGLNTNYFDGVDLPYHEQIENNQNQQIRLGLKIPIFNNAVVCSSIKRKKIGIHNQQMRIDKQKEIIYSEILKAINNTKSAEKEYLASVELFEYSKLSFESTSKKMEKGIANTSEYELAKQRLVSAKVAKLKAELTLVMYKQILEFYKTGHWEHIK